MQLRLLKPEEGSYQKLYLDSVHYLERYHQVAPFGLGSAAFEALWAEHPRDFHEIVIHGKRVKTPRWQQAYGQNYAYTGSLNNALPLDRISGAYLSWCRENIDSRLNGLLINWYEGRAQHYMGKHRDAARGLIKGSPIVTISHGEERVFRLRPHQGKGFQDFKVNNGDVLVMPWDTNKAYTHEVPSFQKYRQRRISVTLRAFEE
jgi:alkylated DNA repair dioxygenase AlkB